MLPNSEKQSQPKTDAIGKSDSLSIEIGKRLVEARAGLGLSQQAVHARTKLVDPDGMGVSRAVLSLYETGVNKPGAREIRILCEALKITPNWLLYGSDTPAKALQPNLEFMRGTEITLSVRLAYAMLALAPEDREALAVILFSMVSKKLNDVQLSSMMMMANSVAQNFNKEVIASVGEDAEELPITEVIERFVSITSEQFYTNWGNTRPTISEDEIGSFDPDNPPSARKL